MDITKRAGRTLLKKSHSGECEQQLVFPLSLVSYTFLSLIKLSKESGTYRELNGFNRSLMSFALGGNETLVRHRQPFYMRKERKLDIGWESFDD